MWIIAGFIVFIGILCVIQGREQDKKNAEKAAAEAYKQARKSNIATSPNVAIIAQAIVSRYKLPAKIEIYPNRVCILSGKYDWIYFNSLGIADICSDDCSTLASALCNHPLLEGKYTHRWRCETSEWDEENWLELKMPSSSTNLQEW